MGPMVWPLAAFAGAVCVLIGMLAAIVWLVDDRARRDLDAEREKENGQIVQKQRDVASAPRSDPLALLGRMRREEL
jgi:hypothetical protein